jgi:photosystem II stability/assembly factor-like uncharacterized protein
MTASERGARLPCLLWAAWLVAGLGGHTAHAAADRYVIARMPVNGPSMELAAVRPAGLSPALSSVTASGHPSNVWTKLATIPGATIHDVVFTSPADGFAAAELGQVWATTDGGKTWAEMLNRGFPYYYYGISVVGQTVIASGFDDSNSQAILTQSNDGGQTWQPDTVLSSTAWGGRIRQVRKGADGLVMNGEGASGPGPNTAWWTVKTNAWTQVTPDPGGGFFGYQFTLLKNQTAYASGTTFCKSANTGATWACGPSADKVFDGGAAFVDDKHGWAGGGEISPDVAGWLHRTTDGGQSWSGRVLTAPFPIRQVDFLNTRIGWAAGGNIYTATGGIYFSSDGGMHWVLDLSTSDEVGACSTALIDHGGRTQIWCIGEAQNNGSFSSNVYSTTIATP